MNSSTDPDKIVILLLVRKTTQVKQPCYYSFYRVTDDIFKAIEIENTIAYATAAQIQDWVDIHLFARNYSSNWYCIHVPSQGLS